MAKVILADVQHDASAQQVAETGVGNDDGCPHVALGVCDYVAQVAGVPRCSFVASVLPPSGVVMSTAVLAVIPKVAEFVYVQAVPPSWHARQGDDNAHA